MIEIIFDSNDGYYYISQCGCRWNIKFVTEQEALEYLENK